MKIQVNSDSSIEGSDALTQTVETAIHPALDRGDRTTRVEVHHPDAEIRLKGQPARPVRACEVEGDERDRL